MSDRWPSFLATLAGPDQPRAIFAALEAIAVETVGTLLFTAMTFDMAAAQGAPHLFGQRSRATRPAAGRT